MACKSPLFSLCLSLSGSRLSNHTCLLSPQDTPNSCQPRPCCSATVVLLPTPPLRSQHGLHLFRGSGPSLVIPCFHSFPSQFIFTYYLLVYFAPPPHSLNCKLHEGRDGFAHYCVPSAVCDRIGDEKIQGLNTKEPKHIL